MRVERTTGSSAPAPARETVVAVVAALLLLVPSLARGQTGCCQDPLGQDCFDAVNPAGCALRPGYVYVLGAECAYDLDPPQCVGGSSTVTVTTTSTTVTTWPGYGDGRLNPDPDEYYAVFCRQNRLQIYRAVPASELIKEVPMVDLLDLDVGAVLDIGDFMTVVRNTEDTITVYGSNGNRAPEAGEKAFSLDECVERNGGGPAHDCRATASTENGLELEKTSCGQYWGTNRVIRYTITARAGGAGSSVMLHETVPGYTTFLPAESTPGWQCTPDLNAEAECTLGLEVATGAPVTATFTVRVGTDIPDGADVLNDVAMTLVDGQLAVGTLTSQAAPPVDLGSGLPDCDDFQVALVYLDVCAFAAGFNQLGLCIIQGLFFVEGYFGAPAGGAALPAAGPAGVSPALPDLVSLHRLRDRVLQHTAGGRRAIARYYHHSPDLVQAALEHPEVALAGIDALAAWAPTIEALVRGDGQGPATTQEQVDRFQAFLDALRPVASAELRAALEREVLLIDPASLAGLTPSGLLEHLERLGCEEAPTLTSVACRLDEMRDVAGAHVGKRTGRKLRKQLGKAAKQAGRAGDLLAGTPTRRAARKGQKALKKISRLLTKVGRVLASKRAQRDAPEAVRLVLDATTTHVAADVEAVRGMGPLPPE